MTTTFIDLFSGCGGLSLGYDNHQDFQQIAAADNWPIALETLKLNVNASNVLFGDLSAREIQKTIQRLGQNNCDVVIGGPPCQGFSTLGKRELACRKSALVDDFVDIVFQIRPKLVIMENVRGFLSKPHPNGSRFGEHLRSRLTNRRLKYHYIMHDALVDCRLLGMAQTRSRYVCIAIRADLPSAEGALKKFIASLDDHFRFEPKTLKDVIGDLPRVKCRGGAPEIRNGSGEVIYNHQSMNHSRELERRFKHVPPGGGLLDVPIKLLTPHLQRMVQGAYGSGGHVKNIYGRLEWDKPAGTVVAGMDKITCGRFVHPTEDRLLTPRECARLQGFPDSFQFLGGMVSQYYMIGNAVPPPLSMALANSSIIALGTIKKSSRKLRSAA